MLFRVEFVSFRYFIKFYSWSLSDFMRYLSMKSVSYWGSVYWIFSMMDLDGLIQSRSMSSLFSHNDHGLVSENATPRKLIRIKQGFGGPLAAYVPIDINSIDINKKQIPLELLWRFQEKLNITKKINEYFLIRSDSFINSFKIFHKNLLKKKEIYLGNFSLYFSI